MKKKILLIFLIIFIFCGFELEVSAYSLHCEYEHGAMTLKIDYNKDDSNLQVPKVTTNIKYESYYPDLYNPFSYIPLTSLQKSENDNTLACPILYWEEKGINKYRYYYYKLSECSIGQSCNTLEPTEASKVDNTGKPTNENSDSSNSDEFVSDVGIACYCTAKNSDITPQSFSFVMKKKVSGDLIYENPKVNNSSGSLIFSNFSYECPEYLNRKSLYSGIYELSPGDSNSNYKCSTTKQEYQDDNKYQLKYFSLNSTSKIIINKSSGEYVAYLDNKEINITNINELEQESYDYIIYADNVYTLVNDTTNNAKKGSKVQIFALANKIYDLSGIKTSDIIFNCEQLFGESFMKFLRQNVYIPFVIAIPIILIVLTTIDFAKVIFSEDEYGLKKAGSKFAKRAIMTVIILLVPTILIFVADLIGVDEVQQCAKAIKNYSRINS